MVKELRPTAWEVWPPYIQFGEGAVENLAAYVVELGLRKPLIVADKGITKAGLVRRITDLLEADQISYAVFDESQPNPTDKNVYEGVNAYKDNGCDSFIGIGGGSPLDAAKGIQVMVSHPGKISDYYFVREGWGKITSNMPKMISIPTTAGTGSEVSNFAIITDTELNLKFGVGGLYLMPTLAVVDPELMAGMPPALTAMTGMDALTHNVEVVVSKLEDKEPAEAIAMTGIKLCAQYLRRAVANGQDTEARKKMAMASMIGAMGFNSKGLGAVHATAHQLSPEAGIPHGLANAIMLPYVMEYNLTSSEAKFAEIAQAMGVNTSGMSRSEAAQASVEAVRKLNRDTGLPQKLSEAGLKKDSIPRMARNAMGDHCTGFNPRPPSAEDYAGLYEAAL